jgi:hypothetical protein
VLVAQHAGQRAVAPLRDDVGIDRIFKRPKDDPSVIMVFLSSWVKVMSGTQ